MLEKLKTLQILLGKEDLVLTGSTALAYHGLLDFTEAKDLDLCLINPSAGAKDILDKLQEANPSKKHWDGSPVNYSFIYEGVKVDIWITSAHEENNYVFNADGVKIASIRQIVKAKIGYNRSKDWIQLMQLSGKIFDPAKFKSILPTLSNHSEEYEEETVTTPKAK